MVTKCKLVQKHWDLDLSDDWNFIFILKTQCINMMAEMRVNKNSIGTDLVVVGVFIFSMLLAPYYVLGDQRTYTGSYESMAGTGLLEGALVYAGWF